MSKEFTAKQKEIVARKLGYDGPMQGFDEFLQSSPALAMKYGMIADKYMAKGGMVKKYQAGGDVQFNVDTSSTAQQKADEYKRLLQQGYTNDQIRSAAETKFGKQTDQDWTTLTNLSGTTYNPNAALSELAKNATRGGNTGVTPMPGGVTDNMFPTGVNNKGVNNDTMGIGKDTIPNTSDGAKFKQAQDVFENSPEVKAVKDYVEKNRDKYESRDPTVLAELERLNKVVENSKAYADVRAASKVLESSLMGEEKKTINPNKTAADNQDLVAKVRERYPDYNPNKMTMVHTDADAYMAELINQQRNNSNTEEKKRITPVDRSKEMANMPVGGSPTPGGSGGVKINIDPATATADQKAAEYNRLLSLGMTDAQIRAAAESQFGKQTADNWSELQRLSSTKGTTVPKTTPGVEYGETGVPKAGAMQTVQAQQTQVTPQMQLDADQYAAGKATAATVTTAQAAPEIAAPEAVTPRSVTAVQTRDIVEKALAPLTAAQGEAPVIEAAQLTPEQMQAAMAQAQTLDQAQKVQQAQRTLQEGELVTGPAVDQQRVEQAIAQTQAAQGRISEEMTVQGQLTKLTADFDTRNPPPWAAGAVRAATSMLAARGLGASSMAGQAIIQAAMESAIPIASADAAAYREMESQNLSNRQQVAVLSAQQRAQFLGQEFDQAFQTRVVNAAKIADIANMNFTAEQQVYLENARLAQSVDLANLNNRQATVIANAATIANMETANLSARQQTRVANAQNFLQMSIANMNNQQQMALFKAQELTQSILSDAAAENTARQFNASSQQQADQFNTELATKVSEFNTAQKNAMEQFNAGEANALAKFNAEMENRREEFNVKNRTVIDQANAQLLAEISTANTAQVNAANFENARAMNNMTLSQYNNEVQLYRDQVKMVFDSYERAEDRAASMATAVLQAELAREKIDAETSSSFAKLVGSVLTGTKIGDSIIDAGKNFIKDLIGG